MRDRIRINVCVLCSVQLKTLCRRQLNLNKTKQNYEEAKKKRLNIRIQNIWYKRADEIKSQFFALDTNIFFDFQSL